MLSPINTSEATKISFLRMNPNLQLDTVPRSTTLSVG